MSTPATRQGAVPAAGLGRVALWLLASLAAGWLPVAAGCASGQSCQKDPITGSQRTSLDYVLENVLDPSAVVPREFQMVNFNLADERVVSGIILRETKDAITVRTVNDTLTIPTADIATRKQTPVSIMPVSPGFRPR